MLVLMWVLNSTAVAAIQFCLLNDFVNQSHISQLEHINDKKLAFLLHQSLQRCSARFDLHVWSNVLKNIGDNRTFSLAKRLQE